MRAGRLLSLLLILQNGRRFTAADLAERLGVAERTVLRDIETLSGSGVPVYGTPGRGGGFQLLDTFDQSVPELPPGLSSSGGRLRRVRVRIDSGALQLALLTGQPQGWRERPSFESTADRPTWLEGSFRFDSYETALRELVALGADVEVLLPIELRRSMAEVGQRITNLHQDN